MRQATYGLILIGAALLYELYCPEQQRAELIIQVADRWKKDIVKPSQQLQRIAVGVNSNLDLILSALDLLKYLNMSATPPNDHSAITSPSDLEQLVGYSMEHCAGIERVYSDLQGFNKIVETATKLPHVYSIGGNAALMAQKIVQLEPSIHVLLAGPIGAKLKELLPDSISTPTFTTHSHDEVHMILEYPKDAQWGGVTASCANRVIFSHDVSNSKLSALEDFQTAVNDFKPDLIILSGAHLMDGHPQSFWEKRLKNIANLLENIPRRIPVHWELATVGDLNYFYHLADTLFPRIDSLGLNEQELLSAAKAANTSFDFSVIPKKPGIEWVSDLLHWLMYTYSTVSNGGRKNSRLTRVHFHSLTFHIVATVQDGPWSGSDHSVMAGARVAGLQACNVEYFTPSKFDLKIPLNFALSEMDSTLSGETVHYRPAESVIVRWNKWGVDYHLSPVLVCKRPEKTVGLGDAISSVGLLYSSFTR